MMQRWSDNLHLLGQSKTEMASQEFRVRVEFIEINEFSERYPTTKSKTSKSTKENRKPKDGKGGKDTQDGKGGKDHHSSLPSRSRPQQAEFITPAHYSFPYSVRFMWGHGARGRASQWT